MTCVLNTNYDLMGYRNMSVEVSQNLNTRAILKQESLRIGASYRENLNVIPPKEYNNYSLVFMSAMHSSLQWLYRGQPNSPAANISTTACVRTNQGFKVAGQSNRHLKAFDMLTLAGEMTPSEIIDASVSLLMRVIDRPDVKLQAVVHPESHELVRICERQDLQVLYDEDCVFNKPAWTDRQGKRIELRASCTSGNHAIDWELLNTVVLTHSDYGATRLSTPLVEASGALERVLALRENKAHVLQTSSFLQPSFATEQSDSLAIQDIARAVTFMGLSGLHLGRSHDSVSMRERQMRRALNELTLRCIGGVVALEVILDAMKEDVSHVLATHPKASDVTDIVSHAEKTYGDLKSTFERREKAYDALKKYACGLPATLRNCEELVSVAKKYDGGSMDLARIVMRQLQE